MVGTPLGMAFLAPRVSASWFDQGVREYSTCACHGQLLGHQLCCAQACGRFMEPSSPPGGV